MISLHYFVYKFYFYRLDINLSKQYELICGKVRGFYIMVMELGSRLERGA